MPGRETLFLCGKQRTLHLIRLGHSYQCYSERRDKPYLYAHIASDSARSFLRLLLIDHSG